MKKIAELIQSTLDTALGADGVYSYWIRKAETAGEDPDEYIVYTINRDSNEGFSDDEAFLKAASATIQYYYRDSFLDSHPGRQHIQDRADTISASLLAAGFTLPGGYFDAGDVDDIGFGTIVFELDYWRLI